MAEENKSSKRWYINDGASRYGPYPTHVLLDWVVLGRVPRSARVSDGGPWISAVEFVSQQAKASAAQASNDDDAIDLGSLADDPEVSPVAAPSEAKASAGPASSAQQSVTNATATTTAKPSATPQEKVDDSPPERDRIVVVGRRQSGKTIYLATVYAKLWRSLNGVTAKALSGEVHRQLMLVHNTLRAGEWPAATLGTSRMEMEIEHGGKNRLMVTLDFAGELFRKAFVEEQSDFPGVKELVDHIDRAAAVILLIDPSVVAGMDHDAAMDDDFGLVQAVQRIRNWPGGEQVPIVLVLTKMDQNQKLLDRFGSAKEFVREHFPALVRTLKQIPIFQVSAIQSETGRDGKLRPRADSVPVNIDAPLQFCLKALAKGEDQVEQERMERERRALEMRLEQEERQREKKQTFWFTFTIAAIVILGIAAAVAVIIWKV